MMQLDDLLNGEDHGAQISKIDEYLLQLTQPGIFFGKDNAEIKYDKQFEEMCLLLKDKLGLEAKKINVVEFYSAFDYLKNNLKQRKNG